MILSAVIFDLNGTILEDEDEYARAFKKVLKTFGVEAKEEFPQEKGIGVKENWERLIKKYGITTDKSPAVLVKETQDAYLEEISNINIRPGFEEFVQKLKESRIQIALATSNTWEHTDKILDTVNLQGMFDATTTGDEVIYNKPDPEIFTVTADKLGAERGECLVIEDSASGVEAARQAGMKVIAISGDGDEENLSKADAVVNHFSEITAQMIDQL